ncbi:MAG: DUF971 domain-containing protein [Armatimonadota bacterium]|nr:DUF971 domain-containing protein [Armatimonadota bacterium]MDR7421716.1 DUF971 domain-containing protein [Armatimonadota bacterium]MDR7454569.1 DUF971 domain-containing protein [Armatimonadota bacterium]MDR7495812.1 DUF971 domain-containing protein [Armatimonadota bacterium]MDR7511468.1 DUF971 domain-containing protein [Armatimonadota bacterium]
MSPRTPVPVELGSATDRSFSITWSDGHRSTYTWRHLRVHCPCAHCVGEWRYRPPRPRPEDIRPDIRAMSVSKVGAYALRFEWSDGHNTGLYTYRSLRGELCECEECIRSRAG